MFSLKEWKFRVFIGLTDLHSSIGIPRVLHRACQKMRFMVELLKAMVM